MIDTLEQLVREIGCWLAGHDPLSPEFNRSICRRCRRRMIRYEGEWHVV